MSPALALSAGAKPVNSIEPSPSTSPSMCLAISSAVKGIDAWKTGAAVRRDAGLADAEHRPELQFGGRRSGEGARAGSFSPFVDDPVLFPQYNHARFPAPGSGGVHFCEGHDGQPVTDPGQVRHCAVQFNGTRAPFARDGVGFEALSVCEVAAQDALVGQQADLVHQVLRDREAAFVIEARAGHLRAMNLRL